jgi:hypothetical protein
MKQLVEPDSLQFRGVSPKGGLQNDQAFGKERGSVNGRATDGGKAAPADAQVFFETNPNQERLQNWSTATRPSVETSSPVAFRKFVGMPGREIKVVPRTLPVSVRSSVTFWRSRSMFESIL